MRLNRPPVLIRFKSYSNRRLIDFYDPNLAADFTRRDDLDLDFKFEFDTSKIGQFISKTSFFNINHRFHYKSSFSI